MILLGFKFDLNPMAETVGHILDNQTSDDVHQSKHQIHTEEIQVIRYPFRMSTSAVAQFLRQIESGRSPKQSAQKNALGSRLVMPDNKSERLDGNSDSSDC